LSTPFLMRDGIVVEWRSIDQVLFGARRCQCSSLDRTGRM
jgi:hypothetical protein